MLSVAESAELLRISPTRVRALIAEGTLPARKVGRAWVLREEDVMDRAARHPRGGRPRKGAAPASRAVSRAPHASDNDLRSLYRACKDAFSVRPDAAVISTAELPEEASFYLAVSDFFLQQRQRELVQRGAF